MTLTKRTKLSLAQLLELQDYEHTNILLEKYNYNYTCATLMDLKESLLSELEISPLMNEIIGTRQALKNRVSSKTSFAERWDELIKNLFLDGFKVENKKLISIEPTIDGIVAIEDDLTYELNKSILVNKIEISKSISDSADAFKFTTPDYNGCLSKARLSLETIIRDIAKEVDGVDTNWGPALNKLFKDGFFEKKEEESISATYTFVSPGSHIPLGFTDEEYTRYGRNLIMSVCYYIIKKYNERSKSSSNPFL